MYCEANIVDGVLLEIGMFPQGCCLCNAACAIIAEHFIGKPWVDVLNFISFELFKLVGVVPVNSEQCVLMGLRALQELKLI